MPHTLTCPWKEWVRSPPVRGTEGGLVDRIGGMKDGKEGRKGQLDLHSPIPRLPQLLPTNQAQGKSFTHRSSPSSVPLV